MKYILLFVSAVPAFSATCTKSRILGVFPQIIGMNCTDYALMIGFVGIISAWIFWEQVTK